MLALEEAQQRILAAVPPAVSERVPIHDAVARFLAAPATAALDLPSFDNSAMDGYAVRAAEVSGASAARPVTLRVAGKIAAGQAAAPPLASGECVRLFTGSPLPAGADAVVMQEDTRAGTDGERVQILDAVRPWENVRLRGEDVKTGETLVEAGERLGAAQAALLAAAGVAEISAGRRPVVGLLATGSELREPGRTLEPGQIFESNRLALAPLIRAAGGVPEMFPLVPDTAAATERALAEALGRCDVLVTSGGVSVGEFDFVKPALERLGGALEFWRVAIKPGKPFMLGRCGAKLIFGLPGNPVSAFVTFLLLARPAVLRWQGAREVGLPVSPGVLAEPVVNRGDRRHFVRVRLGADGRVRVTGPQASHMLRSLGRANGLVDVPPETTLAEGMTVPVWRWDA